MPQVCTDTHCPTCNKQTRIQGPGTCCAAFAAYKAAGSPAGPIQVGARIRANDSKGNCIVCEVKSSTSKRHPGRPVIKRGKGMGPAYDMSLGQVTQGCPSSTGGCCALLS
jgi:hypothetical protein